MNSSDLFVFAAAGAQTEQSMSTYQSYLNGSSQFTPTGLTGWLKEKTEALADNFTSFMKSRLWEYSDRLLGESQGEYVSRFDVGYLGTVTGLQNAEGLMRNYIMANPNVMQLYNDEIIEGYEGDFDPLCTGIGRDNFFFRQGNNGVTRQEEINEEQRWLRTHFQDTIGSPLTFRERVNIHKTWNAINDHLAHSYLDITSINGAKRKDFEEKEG